MESLFQAIVQHAKQRPHASALQGAGTRLSYAELALALTRWGSELRDTEVKVLGLLADNSVDWALADLAALYTNILLVPLPPFFSDQQLLHTIYDSGMDALLTDRPARIKSLLGKPCLHPPSTAFGSLQLLQLTPPLTSIKVPELTHKITYTSGTTGQPKGVCLGQAAMESVVQSLCHATAVSLTDQHLCLLPLSTLLENIGGLYVPLMAGACSTILPSYQVGLQGSATLEGRLMLQALHDHRASTAIMVPQMLQGLVTYLEAGAPMPPLLRFIAVGGAPISKRLLTRAVKLGLPVYEGYGLSECASVVSLNTPGTQKPGSVGKPLPHTRLRFSDDGEIAVAGALFGGYLGQTASTISHDFWFTGDQGYLDDEGYLYITGRKKNLFVTTFGRNVAPEWVERELTIHPVISQAAVFGESKPWNTAVIVPRLFPGVDIRATVSAAIEAANDCLPDYARVHRWVLAHTPFTPLNGLLTTNGRLRRHEIWALYADPISQLYEEEVHVVL